ncbi:hypothetical protein INT45_012438 [Circinella minor]|uniref:Uncharacterized protein n=1 Tax=Circinella minor TaxID=1195481 RepID=A0A8H7VG29_9FUNG|nr:hypothetical protein INT45_012438 [Circinella minor]
MKEMLDALLDYGVKSSLVTGILIEDVHRVPTILEHLIQLANLLKDTTRKFGECSLSDEPSQGEVDWKQVSAGTSL